VKLRVRSDVLDDNIECSECHRVFIPRKALGRRVARPDHSKAVLGIVAGVAVLIGVFIATSGGGGKKPAEANPAAKAPKAPTYSLSTHPRAEQLSKWARAIAADNRLVMQTHSDLDALAKDLGVPKERDAVLQALHTAELSRHLRELDSTGAALASDADMSGATGKGTVFLAARVADANYASGTTCEVEVSFRMDGEQVRVTGFWTRNAPARRSGAK
jgi:hypothetical protein